jgi:hypothetical protein
MHPGQLLFLTAREHRRDLLRAAEQRRRMDSGHTPVTRVTLRYASSADDGRLRELAELDSAPIPELPALVAEVDGRLRAALPLDGSAPVADPFHSGAELIQLLRVRATQLAAA